MDLFSTNILILYFILSTILLLWMYKNTPNYWSNRGVKGPWAVPILGTLFYFILEKRSKLEVKWFKQYGKVYGVFIGNRPVLQIGDPKLIKDILVKDYKIFANRVKNPNYHPISNVEVGGLPYQEWKRVRSIIGPAFRISAKKNYSIYRECANILLNALELKETDGQDVDMKIMYGKYSLDLKTKMFPISIDSYNKNSEIIFQQLEKIMIENTNDFLLRVILPKSILRYFNTPPIGISGRHGVLDYFHSLIEDAINERSELNNNDFLGVLFKSKDNVKHIENNDLKTPMDKYPGSQSYLTKDELISCSLRFIWTGYENIRNVLSFCTHELALNTEVQVKLYSEIMSSVDSNNEIDYDLVLRLPYLHAVIEETLRMHPTQFILKRMTSSIYELGDTRISLPKGQNVEIPIYAMHYCEEYFENANQFIPERFLPENRHKIIPYTYLPFGDGPRNCIAMKSTFADIKIVLVHLLKCYQFLSSTTNIPVQSGSGLILNTPKRVIIQLVKRK